MADTSELEKIGAEWLDAAVKGAQKGMPPGRIVRGDTYSHAFGTREELRAEIARNYEWVLLTNADGGVYGRIVTIIFPAVDAAGSSVNAEVFDHDSGTSVALSMPAKKGMLGSWKATGAVRALGPAEPLPRTLEGPTVCFDVGVVELEERRRLLRELKASGIPYRDGPAGGSTYLAFVPAEEAARVAAIPGWPSA